jgi:hypothetical protein
MAEENLNWNTSPAVMVQTISAAKEFLDAELAKYEAWDNAGDFASVKKLFASNRQFQEVKRSGVGRDTIVKFLGGNWTEWKAREALQIIKDVIDFIIRHKENEDLDERLKEVEKRLAEKTL